MRARGSDRLTLATLELGATLANFEARICLANNVDPASSANHLAIWVAVFKRPNGRNNFHNMQTPTNKADEPQNGPLPAGLPGSICSG
jgi:hypothetical protein